MRKSVYILVLGMLFCLVFQPSNLQAQEINNWELLSELPIRLNRHDDIFFISPTTGWVANGFGKVYKTTNSGDGWVEQVDEDVFFRSIGFANEERGWAGSLTPDSVLFETIDGGVSWTNVTDRITGPAPTGICGLSVVTEDVAYGVGRFDGPPIFIKTINGGATWTSSDLSSLGLGTLIDVHFLDADHGFITGGSKRDFTGSAVVAETVDGGDTWLIKHTSSLAVDVGGEWGWKITFPTETTGYVSVEYPFNNTTGNEAKVLKTTNGGQTWTELSVTGGVDPAGLQGLGFVSENVGWASGRGTASITVDGGHTWRQVGDLDGIVNRIRVVNDTLAFAVGRRGYRWTGTSLATSIADQIEQPRLFTVEQNYPNPFNPSTTIRYTLNKPAQVRVRVLNVLSQEVRLLLHEHQSKGLHEVIWDGRDDAGQRLASGTYLYLIDLGDVLEMKKMVLLK